MRWMVKIAVLAALLRWLPGPPAWANGGDQCSAPTPISSLPFFDTGTTVGARDDASALPATCSTYASVAGPDVVYSLVLGAGNDLTFSVTPEAGYDVAIHLLSTCDDALSCVSGSDTGLVGMTEGFTVSGLADGTYVFYVDSFYATGSESRPTRHQGAFGLSVTGSLGETTTTTTTSLTSSTESTTSTTETTTTSTADTTTTSTTEGTTSTTETTTSTTASTTTTSTTDTTTTSTTQTTSVPTTTTSLPPATTTTAVSSTTTTTLAVMCAHGVGIAKATVKLTRLRAPDGNEGMVAWGALAFPAGEPAVFDPGSRGVQLLIEDLGANGARVFDLTGESGIPPGAPGTGCAAGDGWKGATYHNESGAVSPPVCPAGSAQGLELLLLRDRRAQGKGIVFKAVARGTSFALPVGPLRLTLILGAKAAAGVAGECGVASFAPTACAPRGQTFQCK